MAWFIGQSAVLMLIAFLIGGLVAWLIWGRRLILLVAEVKALRARVAECDNEHLPALRSAQAVEAAAAGKAPPSGLHIPSPRGETTSVAVPPPPEANLINATTVEISHADLVGEDEIGGEEMLDEPAAPATVDRPTDDTTADDTTVDDELAAIEAAAAEPAIDDLARIEGIGPKFAAALVDAGIRTYDQLASADSATLIAAIRAKGLSFAPSLPTWSQQARLLADGDEDGFAALTARLVAGRDIGGRTVGEPDDLARVEGIGPKMAAALVAAGVRTFRQLSESDDAALKEALGQAGMSFAPSMSTWAQQAKLLADGDEEGFTTLTARLIAGRHIDDKLDRIEGIGPKIAAALRGAGIRTYRSLADADQARLRDAMRAAGLRFTPSLATWSQQAKLLADGDEEGFADLTRRLVAGRDEGRA